MTSKNQTHGKFNQFAIAINFISPKDTNKELVMHSKSDNIELISYDNANEIIEEIFESLISKYQVGLESLMKESNFVFDLVQLLYCKLHKINFKCGRWYKKSPDWSFKY